MARVVSQLSAMGQTVGQSTSRQSGSFLRLSLTLVCREALFPDQCSTGNFPLGCTTITIWLLAVFVNCIYTTRMLSPAVISASLLLLIIAFWLSFYTNFHLFSSSAKNKISVIIFEFENFANDIAQTVANAACQVSPAVFVFSDTFIYPPVDIPRSITTNCQVKIIEAQRSAYSSYIDHNFHHLLKGEYVLLMPDATRISSTASRTLQNSLIKALEHSRVDGILFPIYSSDESSSLENITCRSLRFDVKRWTLNYLEHGQTNDSSCEYNHPNKFTLLIRTESLFKLHSPFSRPFMHSFAIQSNIANLSTEVYTEEKLFIKGPTELFTTNRQQSKHARFEEHRTSQLYSQLGIKKVTNQTQTSHWHGCDRHKARCFGTIINDIPEYLIQRRWTPPCCLRNLEVVGRYVLDLLTRFALRHWLEGGSLLGAARNGKIIEWDYDIDIGVYREDAAKLPILSRLLESQAGTQLEDGQGFLWEKALEGDFVKVHYSHQNRMHIDIFPFVSVNGTMTKETWFEDHPQDMPFPEHYLTPLTNISFIGMTASAPNNIRAFLELKFGPGVIENAKYPRDMPSWDAH